MGLFELYGVNYLGNQSGKYLYGYIYMAAKLLPRTRNKIKRCFGKGSIIEFMIFSLKIIATFSF